MRRQSYPEDFADFFKTISSDWDASVDGRVEAKVVASRAALGERPHSIQIDNVFPVAALSLVN